MVPLFPGLGCHELVELGVLREAVDERHERTAVSEQAAACVGVGDVAHLLGADAQKIAEFLTVGGRLAEHHDELRVGEHGGGQHRVQ